VIDAADRRADYLTERNRDALDAWLDRLAFNRPHVDPRTPEQRAAYALLALSLQANANWLRLRKDELERAAVRIAAELLAKRLLEQHPDVIPFPCRRSR